MNDNFYANTFYVPPASMEVIPAANHIRFSEVAQVIGFQNLRHLKDCLKSFRTKTIAVQNIDAVLFPPLIFIFFKRPF